MRIYVRKREHLTSMVAAARVAMRHADRPLRGLSTTQTAILPVQRHGPCASAIRGLLARLSALEGATVTPSMLVDETTELWFDI